MDKYLSANAVLSVFSKNYMEQKKNLPIRPSEMGVLNIITETPGPHTPAMLAGLLDVSKPMITAHLTSLSEKGYIIRKPCEDDKRACYILPTEKGRELVNLARVDMNRSLAELEQTLGEENFDTLIRLLQEANRILTSERKEQAEWT